MAKQRLYPTLRSFTAVSLLTVLLLFGFCPLRNSLTAWLTHSHVTKTNGARLLTADDCAPKLSIQAPTLHKHSLALVSDIAVCLLKPFGTMAFGELPARRLTVNAREFTTVPIYLRYRVWRIWKLNKLIFNLFVYQINLTWKNIFLKWPVKITGNGRLLSCA